MYKNKIIFSTLLTGALSLSGCTLEVTLPCEQTADGNARCDFGQLQSEVVEVSSDPSPSTSAESSTSTESSNSSESSTNVESSTSSQSSESSSLASDAESSSSEVVSSSSIAMTDLGFTDLTPSSDSLVIYLSNSEGSDANDCLSAQSACQTLSRGIGLMRPEMPDHLLLKRGDLWRARKEALNDIPNGRSKAEPSVISYYGDSGPRPIIEGNTELYRQDQRDVKWISFVGLHFYGYQQDPIHPEHIPGEANADLRFIGRFEGILIEDNKFEYAGITIQKIGDVWAPKDFTVRRNIFAGVYNNRSSYDRDAKPSSVFTHGVTGQYFEENVFDYGGWHPSVLGAGANMLSHNVYMQWESDGDTTVFNNNIAVRGASHGIQMRSCGLAQDNFFARQAVGVLMGYGYEGRECPTGVRAHLIDNVVSEGYSMYRGVDPCSSDNVCSSAVNAVDLAVNSDADYQAHGNLAINRLKENGRTPRSLSWLGRDDLREFPKSGNIAYKWVNEEEGTEVVYSNPGRNLSSYNQSLGGSYSFDEFMNIVKNREPGTWDVRYTAKAINAHIREGFTF